VIHEHLVKTFLSFNHVINQFRIISISSRVLSLQSFTAHAQRISSKYRLLIVQMFDLRNETKYDYIPTASVWGLGSNNKELC
jgi:hypothetical protein